MKSGGVRTATSDRSISAEQRRYVGGTSTKRSFPKFPTNQPGSARQGRARTECATTVRNALLVDDACILTRIGDRYVHIIEHELFYAP